MDAIESHRCLTWRLRAVATLVFFTIIVSNRAEEMNLPALAKKARPSIGLVVVMNQKNVLIATGTGFFIRSDGMLVTNWHVVNGGSHIIVKMENGAIYPVGQVLQADKVHDLALLKVRAWDIPALPAGDAKAVEVGQPVAVIGSPLGLEGTLSNGIISAIREEGATLQITAPISHGSSGSPVLDSHGAVIGVATWNFKEGQNLNMAVSVASIQAMLGGSSPFRSPTLGGITDPHDADQLSLAARLIGQHENRRALELLTDLCTRYPGSAVVHARLGRVYAALGSPEEAVKSYRQSVKLDPLHAETWAELSVALVELHQMEEAQTTLQEALKLEPGSASSWSAYGIYCRKLNAVAEELKCFEKAVELDPQSAVYWDYLAEARELNGDAKGAAQARARAKALMQKSGSTAVASTPPSHSGMKIGAWEKPSQ